MLKLKAGNVNKSQKMNGHRFELKWIDLMEAISDGQMSGNSLYRYGKSGFAEFFS